MDDSCVLEFLNHTTNLFNEPWMTFFAGSICVLDFQMLTKWKRCQSLYKAKRVCVCESHSFVLRPLSAPLYTPGRYWRHSHDEWYKAVIVDGILIWHAIYFKMTMTIPIQCWYNHDCTIFRLIISKVQSCLSMMRLLLLQSCTNWAKCSLPSQGKDCKDVQIVWFCHRSFWLI